MIHSDQLLQGYCAGPVRPVCLPWLCDVLVPDPMLLKRRDSFRGVVQILEPSSSRYHGQRSQMAQMDHNTTCPFRKGNHITARRMNCGQKRSCCWYTEWWKAWVLLDFQKYTNSAGRCWLQCNYASWEEAIKIRAQNGSKYASLSFLFF
jgi:hypothetical protein